MHRALGWQSERIRRIEEEVAFVADRVISVSGVLCDEVKQQFRINYDKLRMVYNGIHLAPYLGTVDAGAVKVHTPLPPTFPKAHSALCPQLLVRWACVIAALLRKPLLRGSTAPG